MSNRPIVLFAASWLAVSPALLRAQAGGADADLAAGVRQVEDGDYAAAVITLDRAARGLAERKDRTHELARAYLYLGIAYVGLGSETSARARFRDALAQSGELRLDPEQFPPKVIEIFEKARDESRVAAPAAPVPSSAAATVPAAAPAAEKGKSKLPLVLIGVGGAAAAGIAVAASGGGSGTSGTSTPPTTPAAAAHTDTFTGSVSGGCGSDTTEFRVVPSAAGTLQATLTWTDASHPIDMSLGDNEKEELATTLVRATPASNTSARLSASVQNRPYWIFVFQAGGGPCVPFTLTVTYPQ